MKIGTWKQCATSDIKLAKRIMCNVRGFCIAMMCTCVSGLWDSTSWSAESSLCRLWTAAVAVELADTFSECTALIIWLSGTVTWRTKYKHNKMVNHSEYTSSVENCGSQSGVYEALPGGLLCYNFTNDGFLFPPLEQSYLQFLFCSYSSTILTKVLGHQIIEFRCWAS